MHLCGPFVVVLNMCRKHQRFYTLDNYQTQPCVQKHDSAKLVFQESSFFVRRLVHYQVGRNVNCTNWRIQCDPAWEEFYAAQLQNFLHKKSKCHKVLPASQRTTNHTATPLFCLSCYFGTLAFLWLNVLPLQSLSTLATGALLNYTPLKQFKRLLCRSLLVQVLEANWKTNRRRIGNCKVV